MAGLITFGVVIVLIFRTPNADRNRGVDIEEGSYTVLSPGQQKRVKIAQEYVRENHRVLGIAVPIKSAALARLSCPLLSDVNTIVDSPAVPRRYQGAGAPSTDGTLANENPLPWPNSSAALMLPAEFQRRLQGHLPGTAPRIPMKGLLALAKGGRVRERYC